MPTSTILYKNSVICANVYGTGSHVAVCFHGFGEEGVTFELLNKQLQGIYTFLCINLPFHSCTEWNDGLTFTPQHLMEIIDLLMKKTGHAATTKITLCGYSMGGRIALDLLQRNPEKITEAILIAPDGLHSNFWYWVATQTSVGNKLFKLTMENPAWFFAIVNIGKATGLRNKSLVKFVHYYLDDRDVRLMLYKRWTALRKFVPSKKAFRKVVTEHHIPVHFIFGMHDRIILSKRATPFKRDLPSVHIKVLNAGHALLREKRITEIAAAFTR